jgi:hypothetical protein
MDFQKREPRGCPDVSEKMIFKWGTKVKGNTMIYYYFTSNGLDGTLKGTRQTSTNPSNSCISSSTDALQILRKRQYIEFNVSKEVFIQAETL